MSDVLELLLAHRSIRRFRPTPVSDETIRRAVEAAQMAATSSNVQAYTLLQVEDAAERRALRELCGNQPQVEEAGAFLVVCAEQRRHLLLAEAKGAAFEPNLESFLVAVIDASLFAQNLVVAFESLGLGICYIGGLRNRLPDVDHLLELPDHVYPLYGLCVGEPAEQPSPRPRLAPEAVWRKGRYPADDAVRAEIAEYDARMAAYYTERGRPGYDWSGGLWRKFAKPARDHLLAYYRSKGARLDR